MKEIYDEVFKDGKSLMLVSTASSAGGRQFIHPINLRLIETDFETANDIREVLGSKVKKKGVEIIMEEEVDNRGQTERSHKVRTLEEFKNEMWKVQKTCLNEVNNNGDTVMHLASKSGNIEKLQKLIGAGADVNLQNNDGNTPLHLANNPDIAKALLDASANNSIKNKQGQLASKTCDASCKEMLESYEQKTAIKDALNDEQPIEQKPTQKRRKI